MGTRGTIQSYALQGGGRLHWTRCDSSKYGRDEPTHCGGGHQSNPLDGHPEEWSACSDTLRRSHSSPHQPLWQIHHWWSTGRCWPYWQEDHHRHLWWLGCTWRWCILWKGSHQSGPFCCIHLQANGKIPCQKRSLQARIGPTVVCYWGCQAAVALR